MSDQQALEDAARREVLELEAKIYADPMSRHNVGPLLAQEFWDVSPAGEKVTREAMLERLAANPVIVDEYPVDDTRVDVYGDVAISTGHAVLRGRLIQEGGNGKADCPRNSIRARLGPNQWRLADGVRPELSCAWRLSTAAEEGRGRS